VSDSRLNNVVILGGTSGVGLETAARFAGQGDRVVIMGRDLGRGAAALAALGARVDGADVSFVPVDASDAADAVRAGAEAHDALGSIDVLMCSTNTSQLPQLLHRMKPTSIVGCLTELALPPLHMTHAVLPHMRAAGHGSIILVASDAAKVPTPGESVIGAAMAAICMFARTAAVEAKREGIRINVLTPSLIADTPGAASIATDPFSARLFAKAAENAHLGVAVPADLAELALFLAGPGSARMTGQVLSVNGGISVA
jgi:2-hydroxycyclohexanecarboxyl-CoA dehydrogenase